jgi:DNA-binding transcriptional MerR regulator
MVTERASRVQNDTTDPSMQRYRIGTVASLTGIAVERLRAWERRYGLAPAARAGRARVYDGHQVQQLRMIHSLIEQGHPISTLVGLTTAQLSERLRGTTAGVTESPPRPVSTAAQKQPSGLSARRAPRRIGLAGLNLLVLEQSAGPDNRLAVLERWANLDALLSQRAAACPVDVLIIQQPVLLAHRLDAVLATWPEVRVVALYQFAAPRQREAIEARGIPTLSWPCDWRSIEDAALGVPADVDALPAARQFDDAELIALAASDPDPNQCVRHLVDLISSLNAFAEYTAHCVESVSAPVGAMYARMQMDSAHARALLESALADATGAGDEPVARTHPNSD